MSESVRRLERALDASTRRVDELCRENERLRQERREYQATIDSLVDECTDHKAENEKLRGLVWDMYCLAYPSAVEWEVADAAYDKYSPCEKCEELHGGESPCASATKDMAEECCDPIQAVVVADRMRDLGIEVR